MDMKNLPRYKKGFSAVFSDDDVTITFVLIIVNKLEILGKQ